MWADLYDERAEQDKNQHIWEIGILKVLKILSISEDFHLTPFKKVRKYYI